MALGFALLAPLLWTACQRADKTPAVVRLIAPREPPSTAALPRAQIRGESRYVLAAHPAVVLRAREAIKLPDGPVLRVPAEVTPALAASAVRLDASYSARDPSMAGKSLVEQREGGRISVAAPPLVLPAGKAAAGTPRLDLALSVPDVLRGAEALLTVIARSLPASAVEHIESEEIDVPAGARLTFGYAVEEAGWAAGWPPVLVRVTAGDVTLFERRIDPAGDARDRRWFDASVDLAPLAGRRVRLAFETEALAAPGTAVDRTFAVVSNPEVVPTRKRAAQRSVILVSLDTLRARSVGAYGCPRPTTPALDRRLARAGGLVRTAVVPFPFTPPSHMTLLTGLEPCAHGVLNEHQTLAPERTTLAEVLRAAGYRTAAFTEDAYVVAGNGFDRGFDVYRENRSEESASPGFAVETFADAAAWVREHGERPFFLFVHTYQVHEPYTPPRGYAGLFPDGQAADKNDAARADYEREIRYTDDLFAGFLDTLETRGLADDSIVVVTSDHGEGFGEHWWTGHGFDLHDEALLVPLLVRAPGLVPAGRVIEEQVGLADVVPTLLELLDIAAPSELQGQSFARLLTGRGAPFVERPLIGAAVTKLESVRTRETKYVKAPQGELFYDLRSDPLERTDRAKEDPAGVEKARAMLAEAHAACDRWRAAHPTGAATSAGPGNDPAWMINRDEIEQKLRSLGYVQ